jgi:hypothetical protein
MFGSNELYTALNVTDITDLLDTDATMASGKALYNKPLVPNANVVRSINFYMNGVHNASADVPEYTYTCSCRSNDYDESREIAEAIANTIDRQKVGDFWFNCNILPTLSPADSTDSYNTPVIVEMS